MPGGGGVENSNGNNTSVPICYILRSFDFSHGKPLLDSYQVMLEPIRNQYGFAIGTFKDILQGIELSVMNGNDSFFLIVDGTICHLT